MKSIDTAELKESADIVSVVESTGSPYQFKGENILCLCPFHNDRHIGSAMFDEKPDISTALHAELEERGILLISSDMFSRR